jgi:rhodanese-related sulfurtransferase
MKKELFLLAILTTLFSRPYLSAQDTSGLAIDQPRFEQLMKKKRTVVVDVRTLGEFESGYVGYAINYDVMDSLSFVRSVESLDKRKKYLLYCKSGRRSGKALVMMKNMGFRKVHHLRGGVTEWKGELHKPMEK